jgi:hypothetical protein
MTTEKRHPSTLTLDVYFAEDRRADGVVETHLETCARCRRYVEELERLTDEPLARPIATPSPRKAARWTSSRQWMASVGGVVAAAAAAAVLEPGNDPVAYVGTKGTPAVQALINRDQTSVWDGHSPIHAGDSIALRVACEGFPDVTVATPSADRSGWTSLFEGACPANAEPLGFTLLADDEPVEERVAVVLRRNPLDDRQLQSAIQNKARTANLWTVELTFPKAGPR